nr:protein DA1 [Candidatus Chloroploca mongolica]
MYHNLALRIELRNRAQLAQFLRVPNDTHALGAALSTTYTQNGQMVRTEPSGVAILRGLPATLFQGVTVHELGHVWLAVHQVVGLAPWIEEGFCEVLAHRFWSQLNSAESRYYAEKTERSPDPVYGVGFRRVAALVQHIGFQQLLTAIRTTRRFPTPP